MSDPASATGTSSTSEATFRSFTKEQGDNYAQLRRDYNPALYDFVLNHHTSTGGQLDTILDVGCGPGTAARTLAQRFAHAIGIDPSEGMINTARALGGSTSTAEPIRFEIAAAEDLGSLLSPPVSDGSVDLIVASTAAHWFNLPAFWAQAARTLKPGGSVAFWCRGDPCIHSSMPNAPALQAALLRFLARLDDYMEPGNRLASKLYEGMALPWSSPETPVPEFDEASFLRKAWSAADIATAPADNNLFADKRPVDLKTLEMALGTMSPVKRWRDAHPDDVGTENDITRVVVREMESLLHEAGVEKGKEELIGEGLGVLVMVKKKV